MAGMREEYVDHPYRVSKQLVDRVTEWPEFVAFAKRLGVPLELSWTSLELRIADDEAPRIRMEFLGMEPKK